MNEHELQPEEFDITVTEEKINEALPSIFAVALKQVEIPKPTINKNKDWVTWGDNNSFFDTLIRASILAPIHSASLRYKATLYSGESYRISNENEISESEIKEVNYFLNHLNKNGDDLMDLLEKACFDLSLTGNMFIQPIYSKNKQKIVELHYAHANSLAPAKVNSEGISEHYYFSSDWSQIRKPEFAPVAIPTFDLSNAGGRQIKHFKLNCTTGDLYWGAPDYISGLNLVFLQNDIFSFWQNFLQTGAFGTLAVSFNSGIPSPEIQKKIINDFKKLYEGTERKHVFFTFANSKDTAATFQNLNTNDLDKAFTVVQSIISDSLISAHRIPVKLMNASNGGNGTTISAKEDIINSWEILMSTLIYKVHRKIQKFINEILEFNGWKARIELVDSTPIKFLDYPESLSNDEKRALMNYPANVKDPNAEVSLVTSLGVGGLQSLTTILTSPITSEQKLALLINVFGIESVKANEIINGIPLTNNNTNENES